MKTLKMNIKNITLTTRALALATMSAGVLLSGGLALADDPDGEAAQHASNAAEAAEQGHVGQAMSEYAKGLEQVGQEPTESNNQSSDAPASSDSSSESAGDGQ